MTPLNAIVVQLFIFPSIKVSVQTCYKKNPLNIVNTKILSQQQEKLNYFYKQKKFIEIEYKRLSKPHTNLQIVFEYHNRFKHHFGKEKETFPT